MRSGGVRALSAALAFVFAVAGLVQGQTQAERADFASQVIALTMAYFEGQRSGSEPPGAASLYPTVWSWKQPAYTDMCSEAVSDYNATVDTSGSGPLLGTFGGYYEAGNAVTATGTFAFTAVQRILGALEFMPFLASTTAMNAVGDPAGCLQGSHSSNTLQDQYLREMRFTAKSLASLVLLDEPGNFAMLVGVGDTSTYRDNEPLPSWLAPVGDQQKCYIADEQNPAADIAAQLAAGLAMSAKIAREHGTAQDQADADSWEAKAIAAVEYADRMIAEYGSSGSTCTQSSALENCVGSTCTTIDPDDGSETEGTCALYPNGKPANEQMFVANAALWYSTGDAVYRQAADAWYQDSDDFAPSWNNVQPQGLSIMASAPDGAGNSQAFYRQKLAERAAQWATCSNDGVGAYGDGKAYCRRTPNGSAYPLDVPWGNMGAITNGLCLAALTEKFGADPANSDRNRCFLQRQLGYMFNHKCAACTEIDDSNDTEDFVNDECSACDTAGLGGFSYMVGLGMNYPTRLHSRDAAFPNFDEEFMPDGNLLCGALVAGPYAHGSSGVSGRTESGTDLFTNNRDLWFEAEPALDYSASMICALAGYASLQGPITDCAVRTPLTGRGDDSGLLLSGGGTAQAPPSPPAPGVPPVDTAPAPTTMSPDVPPPPATPPPPPPATPPPPPAAEGCGAGGQPVCAGDDLDGREFECDYGFVGEGGVCVPWTDESENDEEVAVVENAPLTTPLSSTSGTPPTTPPPAAPSVPSEAGQGCGGGGQPVCTGDDLIGGEFDCDYGFEADGGLCVPFVPRAEREPMPLGQQTACGKEGEPVCSGDMLNGRQFECDFGYIGRNGICIPYAELDS